MGKQQRVVAGRATTPPTAQFSRNTPPPTTTSSGSSHDTGLQSQIINPVLQPPVVSAPPTSALSVSQLAHRQHPDITSSIFSNTASSTVSFHDEDNVLRYIPPIYQDRHISGAGVWFAPERQSYLEGNGWHQQHRDAIPPVYDAVAARTGNTIFPGQDDPYLHQQNRATSPLFLTTSQYVDPLVLQSTLEQSRLPLPTAGVESLTHIAGPSALSNEHDDMTGNHGDRVVHEPNVTFEPALVAFPSPSRSKGRGNGKGKRPRTKQAKTSENKYNQITVAEYEALVAELSVRPTSRHDAFNKCACVIKGLKKENSELKKDKRGLQETVDRLQKEISELKLENSSGKVTSQVVQPGNIATQYTET